jgi:hypothetical protein
VAQDADGHIGSISDAELEKSKEVVQSLRVLRTRYLADWSPPVELFDPHAKLDHESRRTNEQKVKFFNQTALLHGLLLKQEFKLKLLSCLDGYLAALDSENPILVYLSARYLFELVATIAYLDFELREALKANAETYAKDLLAAATAKDGEGEKQLGAAQYAAARQSFQEAAEAYGKAQRHAEVLTHDRGLADQVRERMVTAKQRARPDAQDFATGVQQERQGAQQYERLAFKDAGQSWKLATDLFAKAAVGAGKGSGPGPGRADDEIRNLLHLYEQAFQKKDVALMIRIRPTLKEEDVKRMFGQTREYRVSLKVENLDVAGASAVVKGQREDKIISMNGQTFRNESSFTFRLKRVAEGWIIDAVN